MLIMLLFGVSDPDELHPGTALRTRPTYIFFRGSYVGVKRHHSVRPIDTSELMRRPRHRLGRLSGFGGRGPARIQAEATGMESNLEGQESSLLSATKQVPRRPFLLPGRARTLICDFCIRI
jgi:hypothetical protein